jgi:hypothetical protein
VQLFQGIGEMIVDVRREGRGAVLLQIQAADVD